MHQTIHPCKVAAQSCKTIPTGASYCGQMVPFQGTDSKLTSLTNKRRTGFTSHMVRTTGQAAASSQSGALGSTAAAAAAEELS
eukprot:1525767-Amphidinium_carterae.1